MTNVTLMQLFWNNCEDIPVTAAATLTEAQRLESIGYSTRVILVDNGSTDGSAELLWDLAHRRSDVAVIANAENLGNSVARNQALGLVRGDYVLMLDGDIAPLVGTEILIRHLDQNPKCFCVGLHPNNCEYNPQLVHFRLPEVLEFTIVSAASIGGLGHCALTQYGLFRAWPFRTAGVRLDTSGPFSGPGWGWEDNDLFWRLEALGGGEQHCVYNANYHHRRNSGKQQLDEQALLADSELRRRALYELRWQGSSAVP